MKKNRKSQGGEESEQPFYDPSAQENFEAENISSVRKTAKRQSARQNHFTRVKKMTFCALISALGVVILYLGALFDILDLSMAGLASFLILFVNIELGGIYPWSVYVVTSILAMLLLPGKTPALLYALFLGFYPMLKMYIERMKRKKLQWVVKFAFFNVALFLMNALLNALTNISDLIPLEEVVFFILGNFAFWALDFLDTRLTFLYSHRWKKHFRFRF